MTRTAFSPLFLVFLALFVTQSAVEAHLETVSMKTWVDQNGVKELNRGTILFKGQSTETYDETASSMATIGDLNGDGISDFILSGKPTLNSGSTVDTENQEAYIVYGACGVNCSGTALLTQLSPGNFNTGSSLGFRMINIKSLAYDDASSLPWGTDTAFRDKFKCAEHNCVVVSSAGDLNGDGKDDALVSSPFAESNAGAVYIWWGSATKQTDAVDTPMAITSASATATKSFLITGSTGAARARLGWSVAPVGDINADGKADIIVTMPTKKNGSSKVVGGAFVVLGKAEPSWGSPYYKNIDSMTAAEDGFSISVPEEETGFGYFAQGLGDINGDGVPDFCVCAPKAGTGGKVYVIYGKKASDSAWETSLSLTDAYLAGSTGGFVITGSSTAGNAAYKVYPAGDANGDGLKDFAVITSTMKTYVVFGSRNQAKTVSLDAITAPAGFALKEKYTHAMSLGDVNADGADDLAFSNRVKISGSVKGSTYIVMGSTKPRVWPSPFSPREATPFTVVEFALESPGPNADHTDTGLDTTYPNVGTLAPLGDINKDQNFDFAFSDSLKDTGTAYIVIGRRCAPCADYLNRWSGGDNRAKCWSENTKPFREFLGNCVPCKDPACGNFSRGTTCDQMTGQYGCTPCKGCSAGQFQKTFCLGTGTNDPTECAPCRSVCPPRIGPGNLTNQCSGKTISDTTICVYINRTVVQDVKVVLREDTSPINVGNEIKSVAGATLKLAEGATKKSDVDYDISVSSKASRLATSPAPAGAVAASDSYTVKISPPESIVMVTSVSVSQRRQISATTIAYSTFRLHLLNQKTNRWQAICPSSDHFWNVNEDTLTTRLSDDMQKSDGFNPTSGCDAAFACDGSGGVLMAFQVDSAGYDLLCSQVTTPVPSSALELTAAQMGGLAGGIAGGALLICVVFYFVCRLHHRRKILRDQAFKAGLASPWSKTNTPHGTHLHTGTPPPDPERVLKVERFLEVSDSAGVGLQSFGDGENSSGGDGGGGVLGRRGSPASDTPQQPLGVTEASSIQFKSITPGNADPSPPSRKQESSGQHTPRKGQHTPRKGRRSPPPQDTWYTGDDSGEDRQVSTGTPVADVREEGVDVKAIIRQSKQSMGMFQGGPATGVIKTPPKTREEMEDWLGSMPARVPLAPSATPHHSKSDDSNPIPLGLQTYSNEPLGRSIQHIPLVSGSNFSMSGSAPISDSEPNIA